MCELTVTFKNNDPVCRLHSYVVFLGVLDRMVKRRRPDGCAGFCQGHTEGQHQLQKPLPVKGELGAPAGVCDNRIWELVKLRSSEVIAIHGHKCGDGRGRGMLRCKTSIQSIGDNPRESRFPYWTLASTHVRPSVRRTRAWSTPDSNHQTFVWWCPKES